MLLAIVVVSGMYMIFECIILNLREDAGRRRQIKGSCEVVMLEEQGEGTR